MMSWLIFFLVVIIIGIIVSLPKKVEGTVINGTGSPGDLWKLTLPSTEEGVMQWSNESQGNSDSVSYTTENGYLIFAAGGTSGLQYGLRLANDGYVFVSDKMGVSGTEAGIINALVEQDFTMNALLNKTFTFFSFVPASALVFGKGILLGNVKFTSDNNGGITATPRGYLSCMNPTLSGSFNDGFVFHITNDDVDPQDKSLVTIDNPGTEQDNATGFLSSFGFALDYVPGVLNGTDFDSGNLFGFIQSDSAEHQASNNGTYNLIVTGYQNAAWNFSSTNAGTVGTKLFFRATVTIESDPSGTGCVLSHLTASTQDLTGQGTGTQIINDSTEGTYVPFSQLTAIRNHMEDDLKGTFMCIDDTNSFGKMVATVVLKGGNIMISWATRSADSTIQTNTYNIFYAVGTLIIP